MLGRNSDERKKCDGKAKIHDRVSGIGQQNGGSKKFEDENSQ